MNKRDCYCGEYQCCQCNLKQHVPDFIECADYCDVPDKPKSMGKPNIEWV